MNRKQIDYKQKAREDLPALYDKHREYLIKYIVAKDFEEKGEHLMMINTYWELIMGTVEMLNE